MTFEGLQGSKQWFSVFADAPRTGENEFTTGQPAQHPFGLIRVDRKNVTVDGKSKARVGTLFGHGDGF
jgi:hypothetical protein